VSDVDTTGEAFHRALTELAAIRAALADPAADSEALDRAEAALDGARLATVDAARAATARGLPADALWLALERAVSDTERLVRRVRRTRPAG
jgi:hypothetical protein